VEGVFDALRFPYEAVALMGSSASTTQVTLLAGLARGRDVILALDPDTAGYLGAVKVANALASKLVPVRVALLPKGSDIGSLGAEAAEPYLANASRFIL
jgi:DNA primase